MAFGDSTVGDRFWWVKRDRELRKRREAYNQRIAKEHAERRKKRENGPPPVIHLRIGNGGDMAEQSQLQRMDEESSEFIEPSDEDPPTFPYDY